MAGLELSKNFSEGTERIRILKLTIWTINENNR